MGQGNIKLADAKIITQIGGSHGPAVVVKAAGVFLGGDPDVLGMGAFGLVQLVSEPAQKVYGLKG